MPPVTITSGSGTTDDGCPSSGSVNPNCPGGGWVNPKGSVGVTLIGMIVLFPFAPGLLGDSGNSVDWRDAARVAFVRLGRAFPPALPTLARVRLQRLSPIGNS